MASLVRVPENPILKPNSANEWERDGAFNQCVVLVDGTYHMVYRAFSSPKQQNGVLMQVSSIGYAKSTDGINFTDHKLLIEPVEDWEIYGCEDPRITYLDGKFYILYTALSVYPFAAYGIKVAVAITKDFVTLEKHEVTNFNSKAMALLPEKIDGKYAALLTMNTDLPPAKIGLALFDTEEQMWSPEYWTQWYDNANSHALFLLRDLRDHVELGAPPLKTEHGWLVIYSYIKNYLSNNKGFGIEAVLLDLDNPRKILGRTELPLLTPEEPYELHGVIPNVVFPSGALVKDGKLFVHYGAADTVGAVASCHLDSLLDDLKPMKEPVGSQYESPEPGKLARYKGNPILKPILELDWQQMAVLNPTAIYEDGRVHIIYRAQAFDGTSVLGYASSRDGLHINENLDYPIYFPREAFEKKTRSEINSGCEDPRISKIGDRFYMTYTAYDGSNPPRVALTSISVEDFLNKNWSWDKPKLISPPGVDDKDACIVKHPRAEKYVAFHRLGNVLWLDFLRDLEFPEKKYLTGGIIAQARNDKWDNVKIGIAAPPIETEKGWLLLYHGVGTGNVYRLGAMLLDYDDPRIILARSDEPILEPEKKWELEGIVPNVVFPCGAVVIENNLYVYYGGADKVIGVATAPIDSILNNLLKQ